MASWTWTLQQKTLAAYEWWLKKVDTPVMAQPLNQKVNKQIEKTFGPLVE